MVLTAYNTITLNTNINLIYINSLLSLYTKSNVIYVTHMKFKGISGISSGLAD